MFESSFEPRRLSSSFSRILSIYTILSPVQWVRLCYSQRFTHDPQQLVKLRHLNCCKEVIINCFRFSSCLFRRQGLWLTFNIKPDVYVNAHYIWDDYCIVRNEKFSTKAWLLVQNISDSSEDRSIREVSVVSSFC